MYVVYILYSYKFDTSYVGYTSDLINRIKSHNELGKGFTYRYRPWIVAHVDFFDNKSAALKKEKYFKAGIGYLERKNIIQTFKTL